MKKKIFGYVMQEINRLTKDEDMRQELWVYFLEGNSPFSFQDYLSYLQSRQIDNQIVCCANMESIYGFEEKFH